MIDFLWYESEQIQYSFRWVLSGSVCSSEPLVYNLRATEGTLEIRNSFGEFLRWPFRALTWFLREFESTEYPDRQIMAQDKTLEGDSFTENPNTGMLIDVCPSKFKGVAHG